MTILGTNLKIYMPFQKQSLGYKFIMILNLCLYSILCLPAIIREKNIQEFPFFIIIIFSLSVFMLGQMTAMMQINILTRPMSYCLPGYDKIVHKVIFGIGIAISLLYTLPMMLFPVPAELRYYIPVIGPAIILAIYLISVCITFYMQEEKPSRFILYGIFILGTMFWVSLILQSDFNISFKELFFYCLIPLLFSGIFSAAAAWKMLHDPEIKRKVLNKGESLMVTFFNRPLNLTRFEEYVSSKHMSSTEKYNDKEEDACSRKSFYLDKMKQQPYFSLKRSFPGAIYCMLSPFSGNSRSKINIIILLQVLLPMSLLFLSGYQDMWSVRFQSRIPLNMLQLIVLIINCIFIGIILRQPYHNLLLPVNRSGNYIIYFLLWLIKPAIPAGLFSIVIAVSGLIGNSMPEITFMNHRLVYHSIGTEIIVWPLVIIPVVSIIFSSTSSFGNMMAGTLISSITVGALFGLSAARAIDYSWVMIILVSLSNIFFLWKLTRYWFYKDHL